MTICAQRSQSTGADASAADAAMPDTVPGGRLGFTVAAFAVAGLD